MAETVIGTYNMSFAGDLFPEDEPAMPSFASEYSFHLRDTERPRSFWNNAKNHLIHFIDKKKPLAVGLQEMNLTEEDSDRGTNAIKKMLNHDYEMISDKVNTNNAGISIIFDKTIAGDKVKSLCVDNTSQKNGPNPDGGRPLLMVLTENGYLFVSMHGAQDGGLGNFEDDFNEYMKINNINFLETQVNDFLTGKDVKEIYVMGDFNDRYDVIKNLKFNDKTATYTGDSPASCCHNWDSMGKETERVKIQKKKNSEDQDVENQSEKVQGLKQITIDGKVISGKEKIPPQHGITVGDYINKGDKVFAYPNYGELAIYKSEHNLDEERVSKASDHELVYMTISGTPDAPDAAGVADAKTVSADDDKQKLIEKLATGVVEDSMTNAINNYTETTGAETAPTNVETVPDAAGVADAKTVSADAETAPDAGDDDDDADRETPDERHKRIKRLRADVKEILAGMEPSAGGKAKSRKGRRTKKGKKGNRKTKKSRKSKRSKRSKKSKK